MDGSSHSVITFALNSLHVPQKYTTNWQPVESLGVVLIDKDLFTNGNVLAICPHLRIRQHLFLCVCAHPEIRRTGGH